MFFHVMLITVKYTIIIMFMKTDYVKSWQEKIRNSSISASFAMYKINYEFEPYVEHVTIKNTGIP